MPSTRLISGTRPFLLLLALAGAVLPGRHVSAGTNPAWPARPITLVVPFPAGGTTDTVARLLSRSLSRQLNQTMVVDNKSGASGTLGAAQVLRAPADGYTLLLGTPAEQINAPMMMSRAPYDAARDFAPAGCVSRGPNVLVVNPGLQARTVAELLRAARARPGQINFGSAGNGNTSHLSGELFAQTAGIDLTHIPYRGNAPAIADTIGGQVQMMFSNPATVLPHIRSGTLRPLAVTSHARIAALPDVPTLRESGVPVEIYSWTCLFVPSGTPKDIVGKLHAALAKALDDRQLGQAIENSGAERFPTTPEEASRFLAGERALWGNLIHSRHIHAD
ncbi:tripartite tricarboxylate transporter substrate binding protein [Cupriavidus basilensis]|uniref:Tripartite tricarboxylate transporter substrate binding protein n=1 Tax=Cupriavidus basilensis TaxID=68895 RepID=A0ABT6ATP9_9BURK|nr:tripartite tricarboxylate transporter substrate binding protein [Cupriavidus basilensis]MDF3835839.1 tripartite tricarboxylate transporter substrate binding protein [Cupriavidus basilensis]